MTVAELKEVLANFDDDDTIYMNIGDDYLTSCFKLYQESEEFDYMLIIQADSYSKEEKEEITP